ncbi:hypothetical protein [Acinetobacter baumannii]|uniref:Uncharacterized protein n=1 Tax=Acinetobacter baumannii (strain 1295743) TaxID=1310613 RepID=A0A009HNI9_ACIB9|nr:hypothetical protein [Acinetobacter baumannii]EXB05732.1 hypothetical protein J512_1935 [Acinetobacter baumannii 1295743]
MSSENESNAKEREKFEKFMMSNSRGLPPLVEDTSNGSVVWKSLDNINYEELGYFLSCHLIIEHYMDEYLKFEYQNLSWGDCKLTFSQKINLLSNFPISEPYKELILSIKAMNKVRNKISHRVDFKISMDDLEPLKYYLYGAYKENKEMVPSTVLKLLEIYTMMVCVVFASTISALVRHKSK